MKIRDLIENLLMFSKKAQDNEIEVVIMDDHDHPVESITVKTIDAVWNRSGTYTYIAIKLRDLE